MVKFSKLIMAIAIAVMAVGCGGRNYESVKGDPMKSQIYTLSNGLKVYMSVNHEEPRIQTYIAVRVGGKNDPAQNTGLAHYLEHIMFKGTSSFGTSDFATEKPLLDQISDLFEVYGQTTDPAERKAIYHKIDSISFEASKYSIPNEYDKLMAIIGAQATNAHTSYDETVYKEDIPSNQIENWAHVQSDRFKNMVIRGFHTELETVYEEKNRSMTNDGRKVIEAVTASLYPNHPYGQQTVLGTHEHLKNPSIKTVQNYFDSWYVPNNMAICVSGDFEPEEMLAAIEKYFGDMEPKDIPVLEYAPEEPIEEPIVKEVFGQNSENIALAWRIPGQSQKESLVGDVVGSILYNGTAGLIDLNIYQKQKALYAYAMNYTMTDYGMMLAMGAPQVGQTLDEVRTLILEQIALLRNGEFSDELMTAVVNNAKLGRQRQLDNNQGRANEFVRSFIDETPWEWSVNYVEDLGKVTRQDIIDFANKYLGESNYAVVYKRQGIDPNEVKIEKPQITPILTNRNNESAFIGEIRAVPVKPIEPVFVDYKKDMDFLTAKSDMPLLYKENETTDLFSISYIFNIGSATNPLYGLAFNYLEYLGTADKTAENIKSKFYELACRYYASVGADRIQIDISGLSENMEEAMTLVEELLAGATADEAVLAKLKTDMLKERANNKLNQAANASALRRWATYGQEYINRTTLTNAELSAVTSDELLALVKELPKYEHTILYYGTADGDDVVKAINANHNVPEKLIAFEGVVRPVPMITENTNVLVAHYPAPQLNYQQISVDGRLFDPKNDGSIRMFNEYFGGSMNAIVFQEIREARGLAYSAGAYLSEPSYAGLPYTFAATAGTQTDKMEIIVDAYTEIIENMPQSEKAFAVAKEAILNTIRTDRTIKSAVLWSWLRAQNMGVDYDRNKAIYEAVEAMTFEDLLAFQKEWIAGRKYTYCMLGNTADFDMVLLNKLGKVTRLNQEQIFGY